MKHRHLSKRIARIERRRVEAAYDPYDRRQVLMRIVAGSLSPEAAASLVDRLLAMPRPEARALLQAQLDRMEE